MMANCSRTDAPHPRRRGLRSAACSRPMLCLRSGRAGSLEARPHDGCGCGRQLFRESFFPGSGVPRSCCCSQAATAMTADRPSAASTAARRSHDQLVMQTIGLDDDPRCYVVAVPRPVAQVQTRRSGRDRTGRAAAQPAAADRIRAGSVMIRPARSRHSDRTSCIGGSWAVLGHRLTSALREGAQIV